MVGIPFKFDDDDEVVKHETVDDSPVVVGSERHETLNRLCLGHESWYNSGHRCNADRVGSGFGVYSYHNMATGSLIDGDVVNSDVVGDALVLAILILTCGRDTVYLCTRGTVTNDGCALRLGDEITLFMENSEESTTSGSCTWEGSDTGCANWYTEVANWV